MLKIQVRDFDLKHIFECGQCFRWECQNDGSYTGIAGDRIANVKLEGNQLMITEPGQNSSNTAGESFWWHYLDLDRNYSEVKRTLAERDPVITTAIEYGKGIRILRQDPWETLLSFIISQNNNIPRIKQNIESLCENFGEKIGSYGGREFYAFPEPDVLAGLSIADLGCCRLGYRAKYLVATAKRVAEEGRDKLNSMADGRVPAQEAFAYISGFSGVGPKVANCILLFSMGKLESFPIDVWVRKVMKELYGLEKESEIAAFAADTFGAHSGIAQQYLFYYMREKDENVRTNR